jgi:tetratricopeptide (TPR) repeat protein
MNRRYLFNIILAALLVLRSSVVWCADDYSEGSRKTTENELVFSPNEPTVTREESEIITQALTLFEEHPHNAIQFLDQSITPGSSSALDFTLATLYLRDKHLEEAERAYTNALKKLPTFTRARANLARIYMQLGLMDKALEQFQQVLLEGAREPSTLALVGYIHLSKNAAVPAENAYRQAILLNPEDEQAYYGLAKSLLIQERYDEVVPLLTQMIDTDPEQMNLWGLLANAYLSKDQPFEAIKTLEAARRMGISNSDMFATLGDIYLNEELAEDSVNAYQEAMALGDLSPARMLRAIEGFVSIHQPDEARRLLGNPSIVSREDWGPDEEYKLLWLKARLAHLEEKYQEAIDLYQQALDQDPINGMVLISLGDLYQQQGKLEEALIVFEQAQQDEHVSRQALLKQSQLEVSRQRFARAVEILEEVLVDDFQPHVARYLEQVRRLIR